MNRLLQIKNITKHYPGVRALDGVDFDLHAGEIHCLVGENGAGKSTLMKILSGAIQKDGGTILIDGIDVEIRGPAEARAMGIGIVYQDFKLVDELTVGQNILLGQEPGVGPARQILDRQAEWERAEAILADLGEHLDVRRRVGALGTARRQIVEIARALSGNPRILLMDEPSAALTEKELESLFKVIRRLKEHGTGIIYISHRLDEIFQIADRVAVLRDGARVHASDIQDVDRRTLIRLMVGRELDQEYPKIDHVRGEEILRVDRLSAGMLENISFTLSRGEILGFAGLVGAGRSELAHVLFGAAPRDSGEITLMGKPFSPRSPREAIDAGVGLLTEDRNRFGLIFPLNIRENISLPNLGELLRGIVIDLSKERSSAGALSEQLRLKAGSIEDPVESLSGGNRQKVILARWLFTRCRLLIFDEPTAGVDVGAKREIYLLINDLVDRGVGVIMISSELQELVGMCDRIAVMCEGRMTGILGRDDASQEAILSLATQFSAETP